MIPTIVYKHNMSIIVPSVYINSIRLTGSGRTLKDLSEKVP